MEEMCWFIQETMLKLLIELPRTRHETVEEAWNRVLASEYRVPVLLSNDPKVMFYVLFDALRAEEGIEVRRARRGEPLEYGVPLGVQKQLEDWIENQREER